MMMRVIVTIMVGMIAIRQNEKGREEMGREKREEGTFHIISFYSFDFHSVYCVTVSGFLVLISLTYLFYPLIRYQLIGRELN